MITVGIENSVVFAPVSKSTGKYVELQSFSTRLAKDEKFKSYLIQKPCTYFVKDEEIPFHVLTLLSDTLEVFVENGALSSVTNIREFNQNGIDYKIYHFNVTFNQVGCDKIILQTDNEKYISEDIEVLNMTSLQASENGYLNLKWFNFETTQQAPYMDWSTGIVCQCWVPGNMLDWDPSVKGTLFENNERIMRLNGLMFRKFNGVLGVASRQSAEKIVAAAISDKFFINNIEYVLSGDPSKKRFSNGVEMTLPLTQGTVKGLNTHDLGINSETMSLKTLKYYNHTDDFETLIGDIPNGWIVHVIRVKLASGTGISIKAGDADAVDNMIWPTSPRDSIVEEIPHPIHKSKGSISGGIIRFGITGTNPIVHIEIDIYNAN